MYRTLNEVKNTLQQMANFNRIRDFLHSSDMVKKLQQCNVDINNMIQLFEVRFSCRFMKRVTYPSHHR